MCIDDTHNREFVDSYLPKNLLKYIWILIYKNEKREAQRKRPLKVRPRAPRDPISDDFHAIFTILYDLFNLFTISYDCYAILFDFYAMFHEFIRF